jgi:hypothetical protein
LRRAQVILLLLGVVGRAEAAPPPEAALAPPRARICCALGRDLALRLGALRTPVVLQNVVARGALGHHRYGAEGALEARSGLLFTCRGGFIDLGHLRGAADLYAHLRARLAAGDPVHLRGPDGEAHLAPSDDPAAAAARAAYDLTVWHELVTAAGGRAVPFFPEAFSAFSPEDLYSDLLGVTLGARAWARPEPWGEAMDAELDAALGALGAVGPDATRRALDQVAGRWWAPGAALPDGALLLARNLAFGPVLRPWLPPDPAALGCPDDPALPLAVPPDPSVARQPAEPLQAPAALTLTPPPATALGHGPFSPADFERLLARAAPPPAPAPRPADETLAGVHLLTLRTFGGLAHGDRPGPAGGLEVVGAQAEAPGGDLSVVRFTTLYDPEGRGLVAHFTGLQARRLFFCREAGTGRLYPPVAAWFQTCDPEGGLGLGLTLAQAQHEGATGRWALRPVALHVSADLLGDAFTPAFVTRALVLSGGLAVETTHTPGRPGYAAPRAHLQLQGHLRTEDGRWGVEGLAVLRQGLRDRRDYALEAGLRLGRRWVLRSAPAGAPWAVLSLELDLGYSRWTRPERALDDLLLPLASATAQDTLRGLLVAGLALERWVF